MKYAYFPGCVLKGTAIEYESSSHLVSQELGLSLEEIPDWNCCGAAPAHMVDSLLALTLPARNLSLAERMGLDITASCPACSNRLKTTNYYWKRDNKLREQINRVLNEPYQGSIEVKSLLQIFWEEITPSTIAEKIKRPLSGMKIAPYYGCLFVRPAEVVHFDDDENPISLDELLGACGAEVVDFPFKTECCGASYGLTKKEMVLELSGDILEMAKTMGAEAVVVACPLCHQNLDLRQRQIEAKRDESFKIPIYYFTQLIGLALGFTPKQLGINKHAVDGIGLLKKKTLMTT